MFYIKITEPARSVTGANALLLIYWCPLSSKYFYSTYKIGIYAYDVRVFLICTPTFLIRCKPNEHTGILNRKFYCYVNVMPNM